MCPPCPRRAISSQAVGGDASSAHVRMEGSMAKKRHNREKRREPHRREESRGTMSVAEAGQRGGQRERDLVEKGHEREGEPGNRR